MPVENLSEWCRQNSVDYQFAWRRANVENLPMETVLLCWKNREFQRWAQANDLPLSQAFSLRDSGLNHDEILDFFKKSRQAKTALVREKGRMPFDKWCAAVGLPLRYARNIQTNFGFATRGELLRWFEESPDWVFHNHKWTYGYKGAPIEEWLTPEECRLIWDHAHWYSLSSCPRGRVIRCMEAYKMKPKQLLERVKQ